MMEIISKKGIIIKEVKVGEGNKIFTVLTADGTLSASAKGVRSFKSKLSSGCGLFGFSDFELKKGKSMYTVMSAENIESFYEIRTDVFKLALAVYFSDLICGYVPEGQESGGVLRLMLNTLFFLTEHNDCDKIKAVFELRLMAECGFLPDYGNISGYGNSCIQAIKYITECPVQKVFSFNAYTPTLKQLSAFAERNVLLHLNYRPKSLDYYLSL